MKTLLYPGNYIDYRSIDEDMKEEYSAALDTGLFQIMLFNYDGWVAGEHIRVTKPDHVIGDVIYRGWMLKPEKYAALYVLMQEKGFSLLTTPAEYTALHLFPNVYPLIKEDTARMIFFENCGLSDKAQCLLYKITLLVMLDDFLSFDRIGKG